MIFKLKVSEVNSNIEANTSEVQGLLSKAKDLEEENIKLKDYLQQLGKASEAAESALEQLKMAYLMLKKFDVSQMDVLKQEVDNLYLQIKTNELKFMENFKANLASPVQNKAENSSKNQEFPSKSIFNNSNSNSNSQNKQIKSNQEETEAKTVDIEVLPPEEKLSNFEAVMKLQQLIKK